MLENNLIFIILLLAILALIPIVVIKEKQKKFLASPIFSQIKKDIAEMVYDFNELFSYNEEDKKDLFLRWVEEYKKSIYSPQESNLESLTKAINQHDCSLAVCKKAMNRPNEYICKYFNFVPDEDTNFILVNILSDYEEINLREERLPLIKAEILSKVLAQCPNYMKKSKDLPYRLGFLDQRWNAMEPPTFTFLYVSPKGKSTQEKKITFNYETYKSFTNHLSALYEKKLSSSHQRSLMTANLRKKIKERDGYACVSCGVSIQDEPHLLLEIDHIIPISKGGTSVESNLQTLCWKCNRSKGAKIITS